MSATAPVGFDRSQPNYLNLFNDDVFKYIQLQVYNITKNSHLKTPFFVPIQRIKEVMDSVWSYYRPNTGDIVTRYIINNVTPYRLPNYSTDIIRQVINIVVNDIMNSEDIAKSNNTFSIWNTLSGNSRGIVHHPHIKLNERRSAMHFNMNF
jgi:hypothetical protein